MSRNRGIYYITIKIQNDFVDDVINLQVMFIKQFRIV